MVEVANIGIKSARTARILEAKASKLKVVDLMVNKKLERTRLHFEELRSKLKSLRWCFLLMYFSYCKDFHFWHI